MTEVPNPVTSVPPSQQGQNVDLRGLMEEGIFASGASKDATPVRVDAGRLHQLSSVALNSGLLGTSEVGTTSSIDTYFLILDMNGLLLEKRPSLNGRDHVYSFREDVGEFLEFCMKNFEVVFWSCCNKRNLKAMFQALKNVCSRNCWREVQRCRSYDQEWCDLICDSSGAPVSEGPYFFVKTLDTLFQHPDGLKGSGASADNTLLIDDSPYKNVRNNMWNVVHPLLYQSVNELAGTAWFPHQLIPWLRRLKHSGQMVPRFCEANQGFGQRRLLPDEGETMRVLNSCRPRPRAIELE